MNFIITGVGGHLGNTLANLLSQRGDAVTGFALPGEDCSMLAPEIKIVRGNVLDAASIERLFEGPCDVLIHCAGIISISKKKDHLLFDVNVKGTQNIIDFCKKHNLRRLVYVSSVHALAVNKKGEPIAEASGFDPALVKGHYSQSKAMATQKVLDSGLDWVVVHPSGILGPNDRALGFMTRVIKDYFYGKLFLSLKGGYDFVDVRDVAEGIISAVDKGVKKECYILSNRYYEISEIANTARALGGKKPTSMALSMWVVKVFIPLCNLYFKLHNEKALLTGESVSILSTKVSFNNEKARKELGFKPRALEKSIADTLKDMGII